MRNGLTMNPGLCRHSFTIDRVPADRLINRTQCSTQQTVNQGPIVPLNRMCLELPGKMLMCSVILGSDHDPGRVFVKPVNDPGSQFATNPGKVLAMVEQSVHQGSVLMPRSRVDHKMRRLVDDNQ